MTRLKTFFIQNTLFLTYTVVFLGLLYGVHEKSGYEHFGSLMLYFVSFVVFYVLLNNSRTEKLLFSRISLQKFSVKDLSIYFLLVPALLVIIGHLILLKGIPAIQALDLKYIEDVGMFRNSIFYDKPGWIGYPTSIVLKSILPFLLLYGLWKKKWLIYTIVFVLGTVYTFGLMQKSFIVGFIAPALIYSILEKKWLFVLKYVALMVGVVFALSYIHNPPAGSDPNRQHIVFVEPGDTPEPVAPGKEYSKLRLIANGLANRLFIVPGEVVSDWFDVIPEKKPFLYGDGYRVLALIRGRTYHNYAKELYPVIQVEFAARGLEGSVNVASFMYEYSNFGNPGMVLSGFMLAFILAWVEFFFRRDLKIKLCLCVFPILLLSSGAITTLMFSGGFGFTILFYFLYIRNNQKA